MRTPAMRKPSSSFPLPMRSPRPAESASPPFPVSVPDADSDGPPSGSVSSLTLVDVAEVLQSVLRAVAHVVQHVVVVDRLPLAADALLERRQRLVEFGLRLAALAAGVGTLAGVVVEVVELVRDALVADVLGVGPARGAHPRVEPRVPVEVDVRGGRLLLQLFQLDHGPVVLDER